MGVVTITIRDPRNGPFEEVVARAETLIAAGAIVYFKFTCSNCGSRQTFDTPNAVYAEGSCEECGTVTDLRKDGIGFLMVVSA